jgi:predicted TIM-barrel fold metal-dependent hydrolase
VVRIIDVHVHVGTQAMVVGPPGRSGTERDVGEVIDADYPRRREALEAYGIEAVVGPTYGYPQPNGPADTRRLNDLLAAYAARDPARFPWVVAAAQPLQAAPAADELHRCLRDLGMRGMMAHPRLQGVYTDSPSVDPLMEILDGAGLPALIHAHSWSKLESAWRLDRLARRFPRVTIIALDPFSDYENAEEFIEITRRTPNILFDTGLIQGGAGLIERFVREFGPERIVLGNAIMPRRSGYKRTGILLELLESDLSDAEKEAVLGGNAARIFGGS